MFDSLAQHCKEKKLKGKPTEITGLQDKKLSIITKDIYDPIPWIL
jgi:hypothetical protein